MNQKQNGEIVDCDSLFNKAEEGCKKHRLLFDCAKDIILYVKENGDIIEANDAAVRAYGYTLAELTGLTIHDIRHASMRTEFDEQMSRADIAGVTFESIHLRKDGSSFLVEVSSKGTIINGERIRIHIIRDITERKNIENKILYLANNDTLTGISNRGRVLDQLESELSRAKRGMYKVAVMFLDVDGFKNINDEYGHHVGDIVLKTIAKRVETTIRDIDIVGRLGGDEFIIILPLLNNGQYDPLVERIFNRIKKPIDIGDTKLLISISMGISIFPENGTTIEELLRLSDKAMYMAKKVSGNSYKVCDFENPVVL